MFAAFSAIDLILIHVSVGDLERKYRDYNRCTNKEIPAIFIIGYYAVMMVKWILDQNLTKPQKKVIRQYST